jgi:hypothetical protein
VNRCIENKDDPENVYPPEWNGHKTIWEGYQETARKYADEKFLGSRSKTQEGKPYEWKTWREIYELMDLFSRGN